MHYWKNISIPLETCVADFSYTEEAESEIKLMESPPVQHQVYSSAIKVVLAVWEVNMQYPLECQCDLCL